MSKVIVAQSVSATNAHLTLAITGVVRVLFVSVLVLLIVGIITPSTAITPADTREIVVSVACQSSTEPTPIACVVLAVIPATGSHVQFVRVQLAGVHSVGVVRTGEVRVLFVRVAVALFFVASEVLSTFPSPTSPFTIPVGVVITGLVSVLLVSVATALFFVESLVLSTLESPTCAFVTE